MNSNVIVAADAAGNVVVQSKNNPEYGHIRVEQTRMMIDDTGFARVNKISALVPGTVKDLVLFGWKEGQEVSGHIVVKESFTPFNKNEPDRDLKIAGDSGVVCTRNGKDIYRKHIFTLANNPEDQSIPHDNGDEIKAVYMLKKREEAQSSESSQEEVVEEGATEDTPNFTL